jgi:hypothetical protein
MARTKAGADDKTAGAVAHDHGTGDTNHRHRLGDLPHLHGEDGKAVLLNDHGKPLFTDDDAKPSDPDDAEFARVTASDPTPAPGGHHADVFNGEAQAKVAARRAEIVAAVTDDDIAEMERIRTSHPDILPDGHQPRPVAVSGAPGSRMSDVASRVIHLTMDGYPASVHDEVIWTEIATHALVSMREDQARTKGHADPALVAAALDAVDHIARARGLVRETGGGS